MITYSEIHEVRLDGKLIGTIKSVKSFNGDHVGYAYYPKGGNKVKGDIYVTVDQVKATL